jgi:hypothetical protein
MQSTTNREEHQHRSTKEGFHIEHQGKGAPRNRRSTEMNRSTNKEGYRMEHQGREQGARALKKGFGQSTKVEEHQGRNRGNVLCGAPRQGTKRKHQKEETSTELEHGRVTKGDVLDETRKRTCI